MIQNYNRRWRKIIKAPCLLRLLWPSYHLIFKNDSFNSGDYRYHFVTTGTNEYQSQNKIETTIYNFNNKLSDYNKKHSGYVLSDSTTTSRRDDGKIDLKNPIAANCQSHLKLMRQKIQRSILFRPNSIKDIFQDRCFNSSRSPNQFRFFAQFFCKQTNFQRH